MTKRCAAPAAKNAGVAKHMAERKRDGRTITDLAAEFGTSRTTAHRRIKGHMLKDGYARQGSAQ